MGNCFSGCTKSDDSASSSRQKKNAKGRRRFRLTRSNNPKNSRKNSPSSTPKDDKLSVTSVESPNVAGTVSSKSECLSEGRQSIEDLAVIGLASHAVVLRGDHVLLLPTNACLTEAQAVLDTTREACRKKVSIPFIIVRSSICKHNLELRRYSYAERNIRGNPYHVLLDS